MNRDFFDKMHNRENAVFLPRNTSKIVADYYDVYLDAKEDMYNDYHVKKMGNKEVFEELIREPLEFFASCKCCDRHQVTKPDSFDIDPTDLIEKHECLLCCNEQYGHLHNEAGD